MENQIDNAVEPKGSKTWLWILIILVVVAVVAFIIWKFVLNKDQSPKNSSVTSNQVTTPTKESAPAETSQVEPKWQDKGVAISGQFADADVVALMDIYASAREKYDPTVSSKLLTEGVHKYNKNTHYVADQKTTVAWVKTNVKAGDIVLTMGAGNIFHLYDLLKKNPVK